MHDDFYQMYLEELEALTEVGTEEEKILLARLSGGDGDAGKRLIEGNLKKALALAKEYDGKGLPMNDLVQEANMALTALVMELGDGESPEMGFEELLEKRVRESLQAAVDEQQRESEIEENVTARVNVLQEVSRVMAGELGREATVDELAQKMKMTADEIRDIMKITLDAVHVETAMKMNLGGGEDPDPSEEA